MNDNFHRYNFITKENSKALKGLAVIMMVAGHITTRDWIIRIENINDVYIGDVALTTAVIDAMNFCVAIFAFVTGYGWTVNSVKQKWKGRIYRVANCYFSYWIILLIVTIPLFYINTDFLGIHNDLTILEWAKTAFGLSSEISRFNWYIAFFPMAVVTFPLYVWIDKNLKINPWTKIVGIIVIFIGIRFIIRMFYAKNIVGEFVLNYSSRYNSTMPSILIGMVVAKYGLFEMINMHVGKRRYISLMILLMIFIEEFVLHSVIGITFTLDNVWIVFIIYSITRILKNPNALLLKKVSYILGIFGTYSLYIWLIHSIFLMEILQPLTYMTNNLIISIIFVLIISLAISVAIKEIEIKSVTLIKKLSRIMS